MPSPEISLYEADEQTRLLKGAYVIRHPEPFDSPKYLTVSPFNWRKGTEPPAELAFVLAGLGWEQTGPAHWRRRVE